MRVVRFRFALIGCGRGPGNATTRLYSFKPILQFGEWWSMYRKLIGAAVVWVVACGPVVAENDGHFLLAMCLKQPRTFGSGYCIRYAAGVSDTLGSTMCAPTRIKNIQIKDIVVRYLQAHPETRDRAAIDLVGDALIEAYPCQR